MTEFTPFSATFGGVLIGLAAVLLFALNGRMAGISSIASGVLTSGPTGKTWKLMFLLGLLLGPFLFAVFTGKLPAVEFTTSYPGIVLAGLMVGFGSRMGSGCTSGHGICGLSRLSPRSIVAVVVFMLSGFFMAGAIRLFLLS